MSLDREWYPFQVFRFRVEFLRVSLDSDQPSGRVELCRGAFSECSGLEATMEPKSIQEGGLNYGAHQRAGPVTFATVILKRGMTQARDLWTWFKWVNADARYAFRLNVKIQLMSFGEPTAAGSEPTGGGSADQPLVTFKLARALPVKFKAADLNARGTEIAIEELHLVHEGLTIENGAGS